MLPAWLRLVLAAVFAAVSVFSFLQEQNLIGALCAAASASLVLAWFRYHDVKRAERAFNFHDRDLAWRFLEKVPFGGRFLRREVRIYYHHVRSLCLQKYERWQEAAREAEAAVTVAGVREQAAGCHLAAAQAYAHLGDVDAAKRHADAARKMPHNEAVTKGLARVERMLASA